MQVYPVNTSLFYSSNKCYMRVNPFIQEQSPIMHLYQRSQSKSQQNGTQMRSRSKSYRQFQIQVIRSALDKQHIIQKQPNTQKEKEIRRERELSKYYGVEVFKKNTHPSESNMKNTVTMVENQGENSRICEKIGTLLNIKQKTAYLINSQRYMSYESNYFLSKKQQFASQGAVPSSNSLQKSNSSRSSGRKISFFSELGSTQQEETKEAKKSKFIYEKRQKQDRIKEYYDQDGLNPSRKSKKIISYRNYA